MTVRPGYSPAQVGGGSASNIKDAATKSWVKNIAEVLNGVLKGRQNVILTITLAPGESTTVIEDARIGPFSGLFLQPLTSHAATAFFTAPFVLADLSTQKQGSVTFDHANNGQTDKTFNLLIIG